MKCHLTILTKLSKLTNVADPPSYCGTITIMGIENLTLAHFRHFSSLFTNLPAYKALYLRAYKAPLHLSRTLYKSPLFMQNKPNFRKSQMNVNVFSTKAYENKPDWTLGENKPNSNPISERPKMNASAFSQKGYENETSYRLRKNKPNQTQLRTGHQPPPTLLLLPQFSSKFTLKNAPAPLRSRCVAQEIFEKLLICTCFYSIIVLFYTICTEGHICRSNMRKA